MNILQCKLCKKPFQSFGDKICPNCYESMEEDYKKVRDYIHEHANADLGEVTEETGVKQNVILHFLKEGRLEIGGPDGEAGGGVLFCEVCRKPINTGRMCKECKRKVATRMERTLNSGLPPVPEKKEKPVYSEKSGAKMHLDHKK